MKYISYKAGNAEDHKKLGDYLHSLWKENEGVEFLITVKKNKSVRSLSQNSYYWVILDLIAIHSGQGTGDKNFDRDELHDLLTKKFLGKIKQLPKGGAEIISGKTSTLDTKEFTDYLNRVKLWARDEWNLNIPEPKDVTYQRWMEIENSYNETFSGY